MFRKFFIWLIKSVIVIILTTLIFSLFSLDLSSLVKGMFNDVYKYANTESQKQIISQFSQFCSDLEGKDTTSFQQEMAKRGMQIDLANIGTVCKNYKSGNLTDSQFFFDFIGTSIPDKFEVPKGMPFEKYNQALNFASQNKIIYVTLLLVLILILYFLAGSPSFFLSMLAEMSFSMGTLILVPYILIMAYTKLAGIDTTPLLSTVLGSNAGFDIKALINLILLMILRTYSTLIIVLGAVFLSVGIIGKIYSHKLKKKEEEPIKPKKAKSEDEELEEELDKKSKEKEKSMKEVLDELEEVQKKKKS